MSLWIKYILLGFVIFLACQPKEESMIASTNELKYPEQEGWTSTLMLSKAGAKQAVVQYGHMVKFKDEDTIFLDEGVEVDFFNNEGQHTSNLVSGKAEIEEKKQNVRAIDNVIVVSDSGVTLKTEFLEWNSDAEKIQSDSLVMIVTQYQDTLFGRGFEAESDLSRRVIHEPWGVTDRSVNFQKFEEGFKERPNRVEPDSSDISEMIVDTSHVQ